MPMIPTTMAAALKVSLAGCQGGGAQIMWDAICDYVELNAQVLYSWVAATTTPPPVPDPMVVVPATINTAPGRILSLPGIELASDATTALGILSAGMNMAAALWMIQFPIGFLVSPCFVIPSIVLTPSMLNQQDLALNFICTQIIMGIKLATPAMAGTHLAFVGAGAFTSIL